MLHLKLPHWMQFVCCVSVSICTLTPLPFSLFSRLSLPPSHIPAGSISHFQICFFTACFKLLLRHYLRCSLSTHIFHADFLLLFFYFSLLASLPWNWFSVPNTASSSPSLFSLHPEESFHCLHLRHLGCDEWLFSGVVSASVPLRRDC